MSENVRELVEAAKEFLAIIKNITQSTINDITIAWDRLDKAARTMEAQERGSEE